MNYGWWLVVILVTALAFMLIPAWLTGRGGKLERTQLQARLEEGMGRVQLPRAGLLPLDHLPETGPSGPWLEPFDRTYGGKVHDIHGGPGQDCWCGYIGHDPRPYGPFPVDTGPLLHLSEKDAANIALERDIEAMCAEAEAMIPPRWR